MPLPIAHFPAQEKLPASTVSSVRQAVAPGLDAPRILALWHLASFDAPTVAVVWSLAFAWAEHVHLPGWALLLLALMTWSVYVGDRLLDARTGLRVRDLYLLRERHYFHWRRRHLFIPGAALAAFAAIRIILVKMPPRALAFDSLLGVAALAYFSGVHSRHGLPRLFTKEFLVGVIFTTGCTLPTFLRLRANGLVVGRMGIFYISVAYFAALAWLNCYAIAHWETDAGYRDRRFSIGILGSSLAAAGMLLAAVLMAHQPRAAVLLALGAFSAGSLAMLERMRRLLTPLALRTAADFVLLTPILLVPLARFVA